MLKVTSSRIIVLLTPVFTAVAAAVSAWLVKTPFGAWLGLLHVNQDTILAGEVTGATAALAAAITFLHHNAFWEKYAAGLIDLQDTTDGPPETLDAPQKIVTKRRKAGE